MLVDYSHPRAREALVFHNGVLMDSSLLELADDGIDEETGFQVCTGCVVCYVLDRDGNIQLRDGSVVKRRRYGNVRIAFLDPAPLLDGQQARRYCSENNIPYPDFIRK